jgi:hypothetical protein
LATDQDSTLARDLFEVLIPSTCDDPDARRRTVGLVEFDVEVYGAF